VGAGSGGPSGAGEGVGDAGKEIIHHEGDEGAQRKYSYWKADRPQEAAVMKKLLLGNKPLAEDGETAKIYGKVVDYGEKHHRAIEAMTQAVANGDEVAMKQFYDEAIYFDQMQREAGAKALQHFVKRVSTGSTQRVQR